MRKEPDWDLLMGADQADLDAHDWFPCGKARTVENLLALEGMRFRNAYVTSRAIEKGSASLFHALYYGARLTMGSVLHVSDYQESE
jgi:hypothetical protein